MRINAKPASDRLAHHLAHVGQMSGDRRRRRHPGRDEVGPTAAALTAFKVAVCQCGPIKILQFLLVRPFNPVKN